MTHAKTINWSSLDRDLLYRYFNKLNSRVSGKNFTSEQLHKIISKRAKSLLPVKVTKGYDEKLAPDRVHIGGTYYSDLDKKKRVRFVEVVVKYHPDTKIIKVTSESWRTISKLFADTILHEIIHIRQYRARNFKDIPGYQSTASSARQRVDQSYYGDPDEMGAFAFNIACEAIDRYGYQPQQIKKYLDSNISKRHKISSWKQYLKAFDYNHDHRVIKRMKKKILSKLENAANGKPFRTNDWLTY